MYPVHVSSSIPCHRNKVANTIDGTQRLSCFLIGCIFFGMVYLMIREQYTSIPSYLVVYINNNLHLARKYARRFVRGHYLLREANCLPRV